MELRILGPLEAIVGDGPVALGGRKQRALIARLALDANRTVAVERLVDDLWGEDVPETAVKMVQIAVSRLRKVLPAGVLVTRPPGYAIELEPEALDLARFTSLRGEARAALAVGDPAVAAERGRQALELWRGPALAEFPEPFAQAEASHLEELRLTCLGDRIEADLALGRHADVVAELEALVARHPLRERVRGQQMLALHRSGRQADALEAFQRFRRKLDEDLGLVPSAELQELNDRILQQDPSLAPAPGAAPAADASEARAPAPAALRASPLPSRPPGGTAERRLLTVLVAELPGETLVDPEEAHARASAFHAAAGAVVEELGGHTAQQLEAALVAYFGWPRAQEDAPLRAVRAALRIAEETGARAGVDTGVAVVGGASFGAVGTSVGEAQRIAGGTAPGAVRAGPATAELVGGWIDAAPDGDAVLVRGETGVRSSLELAYARGLTPLIGREAELHLLHERWRRAAGGGGQVVFLSGEPGVGKSRLVDALLRRIESDRPDLLSFPCSASRQLTALHAVRDALGPAMPAEPEIDRLIEAVAELVARRATAAPLLVVFEDLHWADRSTLDLMETLIRRAPAQSMLVLATFRPEFRPHPALLGRVTQLSIARLDRAETDQMVGALLGAPPPPALADLIAERTDGVPLFVEEVVRRIREAGDEEHPDVSIPATLQDSLHARLDALGDAKEVAQTAALLAREFPYALLAATMPGDEARLREALDRLVDDGVLLAVGHPSGERYLFAHALLQEAAYDSLLQSTRQELHARVAAVLEERFDELVEVEPECVARHLTAAGRWSDALPHWLRAGEQALAAAACVEAAAHLEAGLGLVAELPDERGRWDTELAFQLRLGAARMAAEGYAAPGTKAAFERAEELAGLLDDSARLAPALYGLVVFNIAGAQQSRGYALAQRLLRVADAAGDAAVAVEAEALLGAAAFLLGRLDDAEGHLSRALELWDPEAHRAHALSFGQDPGVVTFSMQAVTLGWRGDVAGARRSADRASTVAREAGHPLSLAYALGAAGALELALGDVDRTARIAAELLALTTEHRLPLWQPWGRVFEGWVALRRGALDEGLRTARAGHRSGRRGRLRVHAGPLRRRARGRLPAARGGRGRAAARRGRDGARAGRRRGRVRGRAAPRPRRGAARERLGLGAGGARAAPRARVRAGDGRAPAGAARGAHAVGAAGGDRPRRRGARAPGGGRRGLRRRRRRPGRGRGCAGAPDGRRPRVAAGGAPLRGDGQRRRRAPGPRRRDPHRDERRVAADPADRVREAAGLELQAERVQAGPRRDPVAVHDLARGVQDRDVQPRVGAAVAGGPHDRGDPGRAQVERLRAGADVDRRHVLGGGVARDRVDAREHPAHPVVGVARGRLQVCGEQRVAPGEAAQAPRQPDAEAGEHAQVERPAAVAAVERQPGVAAGSAGRQLLDRHPQVPDRVEPGERVAAAVPARHPDVPAGGERDVAPRQRQLGGDLLPARPGADDEDAARGQRGRVAVPGDVEVIDGRGLRGAGHVRHVEGAGGDDDVAGRPLPHFGPYVVTVLDREHRRLLDHRRAERARVALEVADERPAPEEAVGVGGRRGAGQPVEPVRGQERERVPALAAPALPHAAALEHDVVAAEPGQLVAERQPGLPGPDDDGLDAGHGQCSSGCWPSAALATNVVRAVGAQRVHERPGADVAVRAAERVAVEVAGAAGERERAVDDAGGALVDERLRGLRLGEERGDLLARPGRGGVGGDVVVEQRRRPREDGARGGEVDRVLGDEGPAARVRGCPAQRRPAALSAIPSDAAAWKRPASRLRSM